MLTFFGTFIFIFWMTLFVFLTFYNRKAKISIHKFVIQARGLKPTVFENIKLRYWTTSGNWNITTFPKQTM